MLFTQFQVSKPSGFEEEVFFIFFYVFLCLKLGPLARNYLGPLDLQVVLNLGPSSQVVLKKILNIFLCISMART